MGRITGTDQYLPYFVVSKLSHLWGVAGLHVSSVYAGSLSTVSSGINAMAMVRLIFNYLKHFVGIENILAKIK